MGMMPNSTVFMVLNGLPDVSRRSIRFKIEWKTIVNCEEVQDLQRSSSLLAGAALSIKHPHY
jgi:hypothetical protein